MSANNYLLIKRVKDGFEVHEMWAEDCDEPDMGVRKTCKTPKGALDFCKEYMEKNEVEYGIHWG